MMRLAKVVGAFLLGLLLNHFAGPRWSSWEESFATVAFCIGAIFLAAFSLGGLIRGGGALAAMIVFAVSFLWPAVIYHGPMRDVKDLAFGVLFVGVLEVLPALAGGLLGLGLHRFKLGVWWFVAAAIVALSLIAIGPPRRPTSIQCR